MKIMEKTSQQIEEDVYMLILGSSLANIVRGKIYRDGTRPKNASTEDVVVKFLTGIDEQEQRGIVLIHIYVPNIRANRDGESVKDTKRINRLQSEVNSILSSINGTEYLFTKDNTPQSFPVEGIDQYFINVRINYKRKTF